MYTKLVFVALSLAIASAATAADISSPARSPITASAAKKALEVRFADGDRRNILEVEAGSNGSLATVEIVDASAGIKVPGNTITAGANAHELNTSLTLKQAEGQP